MPRAIGNVCHAKKDAVNGEQAKKADRDSCDSLLACDYNCSNGDCDVNYDHSYIVHSLSLPELDALTITMADDEQKRQFLAQILSEIAQRMTQSGKQEARESSAVNLDKAVALIEQNQMQEGLITLANARKDNESGAGEYYDKVVATLIKRKVKQLLTFPNIGPPKAIDLADDHWLIARCPARIDLYGGWSDTPPICFELGGSVVNCAIKVNHEKPIGARLKKIALTEANNEPLIVIHELGANYEVVNEIPLFTLEDMRGYDEPFGPGNLVKGEAITRDCDRSKLL